MRAGLRMCGSRGTMAVISRKGDEDAGAVYVKLIQLGLGCRVMTRARGQEGEAIWLSATGEDLVKESQADDYLARQYRVDPDIWVVEIEDRDGWHPFGELLV